MIEIKTRGLDPTDRDPRRIGARIPDRNAEIKMTIPVGLEGREAHEAVARRLLNDGERLSWDRDLTDGYVFLIIGS